MKLTEKIQKAINIASSLHLGQNRKGTSPLPFIVHPFSVAWILGAYTDDENIIAAGLLHDVLEDVKGYDFDDMTKDIGTKIAEIVREVSEVKDDEHGDHLSWESRKIKYLEHLNEATYEAMMVSAADKIHNLRSLAELFKTQGESIWKHFHSPAGKRLWFYEEVEKILRKRLDNKIVDEVGAELESLRRLIS